AQAADPGKPDAPALRQGARQGPRLRRRLPRRLSRTQMHRPLRPERNDQRCEKRRLNPLGGEPVDGMDKPPACPPRPRGRTKAEEADICCATKTGQLNSLSTGPGSAASNPAMAPPYKTAAGSGLLPRMMSEAFSATMIVGAFVLQEGTKGMTDASTTLRPSIPRSLRSGVTTASGPAPIA